MTSEEEKTADNILLIVRDLQDATEAIEFARLYMKSIAEAMHDGSYEWDVSKVYRILAENDERFKGHSDFQWFNSYQKENDLLKRKVCDLELKLKMCLTDAPDSIKKEVGVRKPTWVDDLPSCRLSKR